MADSDFDDDLWNVGDGLGAPARVEEDVDSFDWPDDDDASPAYQPNEIPGRLMRSDGDKLDLTLTF